MALHLQLQSIISWSEKTIGYALAGLPFLCRIPADLLYQIRWKQEGCKPFERKPVSTSRRASTGRRQSTGPTAASSAPPSSSTPAKPQPTTKRKGTNFTKIWTADNKGLDAVLRSEERVQVPTLDAYLAPVVEQMDPDAGVEEDYKMVNDKVN